MTKNSGGLCKTLHSDPEFRTSLVDPHSIFLESSNSAPSISPAPSREVARSLRSPRGDQDLVVLPVRCADAHDAQGSSSFWWALQSKATAGLRPIQISHLHIAALRDDALDLINSLFVCIISLRKDY